MIEESVARKSESFAKIWNQQLADVPALHLDGSWPSVGVLDVATRSNRQAERFDPPAAQFLNLCSCYLGELAYGALSRMGISARVHEVAAGGELPPGVTITISAGPMLSVGDRHQIPIEHALRSLLLELPAEFPVIENFNRTLFPNQNYLSLFGLGLVSGLSPYADGAWNKVTLRDLADPLQSVWKHLASQSAEHYGRLYPDEQLGQVAELYLGGLIYPPMMMNEMTPCFNSIKGMLNFRRDFSIPDEAMLRLTANLAQSPDDLISQTGLGYYGAICSGAPSRAVVAAAELKGDAVGLLRTAMNALRNELGLAADWISSKKLSEEELQRFRIEKELGLLPWVILSPKTLKLKSRIAELPDLIFALTLFQWDDALKLSTKLVEEHPGEMELQFQKIFLELMQPDETEDFEKRFKQLLSEPGADHEPLLFYFWSVSEFVKERFDEALRYAERSFSLIDATNLYYAKVVNHYVWVLMVAEKLEDALAVCERFRRSNAFSLAVLSNHILILRLLQRYEQASILEREVASIAPLDPRIFEGILFSAE